MSLYILMKSQDLSVSRPIQSYVCDLKKKSCFQQFITHTITATTTTTTITKSTTNIPIKGGEKEWKSKNLLFICHWQAETQETQMLYWRRNYYLIYEIWSKILFKNI